MPHSGSRRQGALNPSARLRNMSPSSGRRRAVTSRPFARWRRGNRAERNGVNQFCRPRLGLLRGDSEPCRILAARRRQERGSSSAPCLKMPGTAYERIVYKNPSEYHYMKVCLEFQEHGVGLNTAQFKQLLVSALKDLFGEVGAALPVDILTYEEKTLSAILRVCSSGLAKLWSSLTLFGAYKNKKCAFRVIQVSPFLLALSGNSREQCWIEQFQKLSTLNSIL